MTSLLGKEGPGSQLSLLCTSFPPRMNRLCELPLASEVLGDFTSTTLHHSYVHGCDPHHVTRQDGHWSGVRGSGFRPCSETLSKSLMSPVLNFLDSKMIPVCQALHQAPHRFLSLHSYNHLTKSFHVTEEEMGTQGD